MNGKGSTDEMAEDVVAREVAREEDREVEVVAQGVVGTRTTPSRLV